MKAGNVTEIGSQLDQAKCLAAPGTRSGDNRRDTSSLPSNTTTPHRSRVRGRLRSASIVAVGVAVQWQLAPPPWALSLSPFARKCTLFYPREAPSLSLFLCLPFSREFSFKFSELFILFALSRSFFFILRPTFSFLRSLGSPHCSHVSLTSFFTRISTRSSLLHSALMYLFFTVGRPLFFYYFSSLFLQTSTSCSLAPHRLSHLIHSFLFLARDSETSLLSSNYVISLPPKSLFDLPHLSLSLSAPLPRPSLLHTQTILENFAPSNNPPTVRNVDSGFDSLAILAPPLAGREGEKTQLRQGWTSE